MTTAPDHLLQLARQHGVAVEGIGRGEIGRALAQVLGLDWVELGDRVIPAELLTAVPRRFVLANTVIPFAQAAGVLHVALADPTDTGVLDDLAHLTDRPVLPVLAEEEDIRRAIARVYAHDLREEAAEAAHSRVPFADAGDAVAIDANDAPVIRLVHELIAGAIRSRASDIHLEPLERRFRVRHRIDGLLQPADSPDKSLQLPVVSRLKIMAGLSIAEKRVPQDGRIQAEVDGRTLDLRVSTLPTVHGESVVMRVLDPTSLRLGLPEIGLLPDDEAVLAEQISSPDGIMLVTGPTGSGKTTTLYAGLHLLNKTDRKIITVEDPVEYQIAGINQVPVNPATGLTFAAALRAILRQSPNLVMVGEIRDRETADIALNAALTGHMVFSTLHTNDAPSAVMRLIDMGARPFLVSAALRSVVSQRLVRRICARCRQAHQPSARELQALGLDPSRLAAAQFARGAGCPACQGTGYRGRMGIFEILLIDDPLRAMIYDNVTAARLRQQARLAGMRTMREDGVRKVLAGLTTIEEVVSATAADHP